MNKNYMFNSTYVPPRLLRQIRYQNDQLQLNHIKSSIIQCKQYNMQWKTVHVFKQNYDLRGTSFWWMDLKQKNATLEQCLKLYLSL